MQKQNISSSADSSKKTVETSKAPKTPSSPLSTSPNKSNTVRPPSKSAISPRVLIFDDDQQQQQSKITTIPEVVTGTVPKTGSVYKKHSYQKKHSNSLKYSGSGNGNKQNRHRTFNVATFQFQMYRI